MVISKSNHWKPSNKKLTSTSTNKQTITPGFHVALQTSSSPMLEPKTLLNTVSKKIKVQVCMICKSMKSPNQISLD